MFQHIHRHSNMYMETFCGGALYGPGKHGEEFTRTAYAGIGFVRVSGSGPRHGALATILTGGRIPRSRAIHQKGSGLSEAHGLRRWLTLLPHALPMRIHTDSLLTIERFARDLYITDKTNEHASRTE